MQRRKVAVLALLATLVLGTVPRLNAGQEHLVNTAFLQSRANLTADLVLTEVPLGLNSSSSLVRVAWTPEVSGVLRYSALPSGADPANYPYELPAASLETNQPGLLEFYGSALPAGVWYAVVVSGNDHSAEFTIIREADESPRMIGPQTALGDSGISTNAPTFSWEPVAGVPFYHVILSDTPFEVEKDDQGNTVTRGANIIWQAITPETSILYPTPDPSGFFADTQAPPLVKGVRYNWIVLNNYGNNPALTSSVTGGPTGFSVNVPLPFDPPVNLYPEPGALISGDVIPFSWSNIPDAVLYYVYISRYEEVNGSQALVPVWSGITTEPTLDFDASLALQEGYYVWKVLAQDESGKGAMGDTTGFYYSSKSAPVTFRTYDLNGLVLPRVNLSLQVVGGGLSPFPLATDDTGALDRDLPLNDYEVTASKSAYEDTTVFFSVTTEAEHVTVTIRLRRSPATVHGSTVDQDGNPLPYATVTAALADSDYTRAVSSDQNGRFSLSLDAGHWRIQATKPSYEASVTRELILNAGDDVDLDTLYGEPLVLTERQLVVSGTVLTPELAPVWHATVSATKDEETETAYTDASGNYALNLSPGTWTLKASKDGYSSQPPVTLELLDHDVAQDFELTPRANVLSGQVLSGGEPLEGATVRATPGSGTPVEAQTDAFGSYNLSLPQGDYTVNAQKDGYATSEDKTFSLGLGETVTGVDFELTPLTAWIEGTTTDAAGEALADVHVSNGDNETISAEDGSFRLGVPPGTHTLRAEKTGYITPQPATVSVGPGQTVTGVDFSLAPNASVLTGGVRSDGLPVAQAVVTASSGESVVAQTETADDGSYRLSVAPGDYVLKCQKTNYLATPESLAVKAGPGQTFTGLDFELALNVATLSGSVTEPSGPVRAATVRAQPSGSSEISYETQTGTDGTYILKVPPGTSYTLTAEKRGYQAGTAATGVLAAGSSVTFDLAIVPQQSAVVGTVHDSSGNALAGVTVQAVASSASFEGTTDSRGNFYLGVEAGTYTLTASKAGYATASREVTVAVGDTAGPVLFTLQPTFGSMDVLVTDTETGRPVAGATVRATEAATGLGATGTTDTSGQLLLDRLVPGIYSLTASHSAYAEQTLEGKVLASNASLHVDFQLRKLTGRIAGICQTGGEGIPNVTVVATDSLGSPKTVVTAADGSYRFDNVPPGSYTVRASLAGYRSDGEKAVRVTDQTTARADFALYPNTGTIRGVVTDEHDVGVEHVQIVARGANGNEGQDTTDVDGSFLIASLAPDTYTVTATLAGYTSAPSDTQVVLTEGSTLQLRFGLRPNRRRLTGWVRSQTGSALSNVAVKATFGTETLQARTSVDGAFALEGLPPESQVRLTTVITKQGFDNADTSVTVGNSDLTGVVLRVVVHRASISGNAGLQGVKITATSGPVGNVQTFTDASGNYRLENLYAGTYTVAAEKAGYLAQPEQMSVAIASPESEVNGVDFSLQEIKVALGGRVVSRATSRPVPNAAVSLWSRYGTQRAQTDANGRFTFSNLPPETDYSVGTALPQLDFDNADTTVHLATTNGTTGDLRVGVHNSVLYGRVTNTGGAPVAGATVQISELDTVLSTDAEGRFRLAHLAPGTVELVATAPGYRLSQIQTSLSEFDSTAVTFQLTRRQSAIFGTVKADGIKLENALVTLLQASDSTELAVDTTDVAGTYAFENLTAGTGFLLLFQKTGYRDTVLGPVVLSGQNVALNVDLLPLPNAILGTVTLAASGQPATGAQVLAQGLNGASFATHTGPFGDFVFASLPAGTYSLAATLDSLASPATVATLEAGKSVRKLLRLQRTAGIRGVVRQDDNPVSEAAVVATNNATGVVASARSDSNGSYQLTGLLGGDYVITATAIGYVPDPPYHTLSLKPGEQASLDITLRPQSNAIFGRVTDPHQAGLYGVQITAQGNSGKTVARTDRNGEYRMEGVRVGTYVVTAELFGYRSPGPDTVNVTVDAPAVANFVLQPILNRISGTVTDSLTGGALGGVVVTASAGSDVFRDTTSADGRYLLEVIPGVYGVEFEKEGYVSRGPFTVEVREGQPVELSVALDRVFTSTTVEGMVMRRGKGLSNVEILLKPLVNRFAPRTVRTGSDGHFRFENVQAPAPYKLRAFRQDLGELWSPRFELQATGYTHNFRYPGGQINVHVTEAGKRAVQGLPVAISGPGLNFRAETDTAGWVRTADNLRGGQYKISLETPDNLVGPEPFALTLPEDSVRNLEVWLPFVASVPESCSVDAPLSVALFARAEATDTVWAYFKPVGASAYVRTALSASDTAESGGFTVVYTGKLPAQAQTGKLLCYFKTTFRGLNYTNKTEPYVVKITGSGVLKRVELVATSTTTTVRVPILVEARAYDLNNKPVRPDSVRWSLVQGDAELQPNSSDPTKAIFLATQETQAIVRADVIKRGRKSSSTLEISAEQHVLASLTLTAERREISSRETLRISYAALDTAGHPMTVWPRWTLRPSTAGRLEVTEDGQFATFVPDTAFFGQVFIQARDSLTGTTVGLYDAPSVRLADRGLSVYQAVTYNSPATEATDGQGFRVQLPANPVPEGTSLRLRLKKFVPADVKRLTAHFELVGELYNLIANTALSPGKKATLVFPLPPGESAEDFVVGRWNSRTLGWDILPSRKHVLGLAVDVTSFSEFALLQASEPLDLKQVVLKPNPFSPNDPYGLQIGFRLTSNDVRKPFVTVKIYNMRGQLVRTLVRDEPMPKGLYEPGDPRCLRWDGTTDDGRLARNGRYVVQIRVKDGTGTKEVLKSVVLIK